FVSVTLSMSARKSSHRTIFLIVSSGSPLALIASSLRSTPKKPVCPMTRSLHPPMAHCGQRVRFAATCREEFFEVPKNISTDCYSFARGGPRASATSTHRPLPQPETKARQRSRQQRKRRVELGSNAARCPCSFPHSS